MISNWLWLPTGDFSFREQEGTAVAGSERNNFQNVSTLGEWKCDLLFTDEGKKANGSGRKKRSKRRLRGDRILKVAEIQLLNSRRGDARHRTWGDGSSVYFCTTKRTNLDGCAPTSNISSLRLRVGKPDVGTPGPGAVFRPQAEKGGPPSVEDQNFSKAAAASASRTSFLRHVQHHGACL